MSFKLLITIIFVSLVLAAAVLGYRLFYQAPVSSTATTDQSGVTSAGLTDTTEDGQIDAEATEYTRLLGVIEGIDSIDRSIFSKTAFTSLVNPSVAIPNLVPGRGNPFAPVGAP